MKIVTHYMEQQEVYSISKEDIERLKKKESQFRLLNKRFAENQKEIDALQAQKEKVNRDFEAKINDIIAAKSHIRV